MRRYFIAVERSKCKDCGYPIICEAGEIAGDYDFHIYCSNPDCQNHKGITCFDTEIDEEHVPFLQPIENK